VADQHFMISLTGQLFLAALVAIALKLTPHEARAQSVADSPIADSPVADSPVAYDIRYDQSAWGSQACPECNHEVCRLTLETRDEQRDCFRVEYKSICIPKVKLPWESCCKPRCGEVRSVKVLTRHQYTCPQCHCKWEVVAPELCNPPNAGTHDQIGFGGVELKNDGAKFRAGWHSNVAGNASPHGTAAADNSATGGISNAANLFRVPLAPTPAKSPGPYRPSLTNPTWSRPAKNAWGSEIPIIPAEQLRNRDNREL